ncbi:hypothetical protein T08_7357 [Trichinella sp. T8]|nr:hypothetical protein T08_7357 [Trichinella sp. T8]
MQRSVINFTNVTEGVRKKKNQENVSSFTVHGKNDITFTILLHFALFLDICNHHQPKYIFKFFKNNQSIMIRCMTGNLNLFINFTKHYSAVGIHGHLNSSLLFSFLPSSSMEGDRSQNANQRKQNKIKMLMATAFLRSLRYLLDITGLVATFFDYFQREWMTPNRLSLWNAYNKNIQTNNYLDGWYFRINWKMRKHHLSFYELL